MIVESGIFAIRGRRDEALYHVVCRTVIKSSLLTHYFNIQSLYKFCTQTFYASCHSYLPKKIKRLFFVMIIYCVLCNGRHAFIQIILINFGLQINEEQIAEFKLSHATY